VCVCLSVQPTRIVEAALALPGVRRPLEGRAAVPSAVGIGVGMLVGGSGSNIVSLSDRVSLFILGVQLYTKLNQVYVKATRTSATHRCSCSMGLRMFNEQTERVCGGGFFLDADAVCVRVDAFCIGPRPSFPFFIICIILTPRVYISRLPRVRLFLHSSASYASVSFCFCVVVFLSVGCCCFFPDGGRHQTDDGCKGRIFGEC
jgi:hypothetical protein